MSSDPIEKIVDHLERSEASLRATQERSREQERRTGNLIQALFLAIAAIALVNIYYVNDLFQEVKVIMRSMTTMYTRFGEMSERVHGMRGHVESMSGQIGLMPVMVEQMGNMSERMAGMRGDVGEMRERLASMTGEVSVMEQDIGSMSLMLHDVTGKVIHIRRSVGAMSNVVP
jgi:hypothetical protein